MFHLEVRQQDLLPPLPPMGTAPVLTRQMQTCLTRQLPTRLHCLKCMLSSDPVNCGANVAKWIGKNKENLPCWQLWVKENCLLLADRHQHVLSINILKEEIARSLVATKDRSTESRCYEACTSSSFP